MYKIVNEIVYSIVYKIFVFYEFISERWYNLKLYFTSLNENIAPLALEKTGFQYLKKKPEHISFLLDEPPSYKDLANLVIWCMTARISFVSFYDHRGILKKHEERLEEEVSKRKLPSDHIFWHSKRTPDFKNGFTGRKIHVKILTENDSKKNLENVCKRIILRNKDISDITVNYIDENLKEQFEFPDPDVGVIFSEIYVLFNYPPWQVRLTEFYKIKSHYNISFKDFVNVLVRYSKCDQRLGT